MAKGKIRRKVEAKLDQKLVHNWRAAPKMASMRSYGAATGILASWNSLPAKWQEAVPIQYVIYAALATLVLGAVGRLWKQQDPALCEPPAPPSVPPAAAEVAP